MVELTQYDIEEKLATCYHYGTIKQVAAGCGTHPAQLAQEINPNDTRKSAAFRFYLQQRELDRKDPVEGERHWQFMCQFRELALPSTGRQLSISDELANSAKEDADVVIAIARDKPLFEQLSEVMEAIREKERLKRAIIEAINADEYSQNKFSPRDFAREAVNRRA